MITKTTVNMAARRGVAITEWTETRHKRKVTIIEIAAMEDGEPADEYHAAYRLTDDGLFFDGSCMSDAEEWPNWIDSDTTLRSLLPAMAAEIAGWAAGCRQDLSLGFSGVSY